MAFPTSNPLTITWFNNLLNDAVNIKGFCTLITTGTAAGGAVSSQLVLNLATACVQVQADIATVSGNSALTTAVVTYFNQQPGWAATNVTTEFTTLNTLSGNLLTAIKTDYPHDGSGRLLDRTFGVSGLVWVTFTAAQLPSTMPALAAMLAEL